MTKQTEFTESKCKRRKKHSFHLTQKDRIKWNMLVYEK